MIELHVTEPSPVSLRYVEAAIKPEQVKDVTPLYEPQTVLPDAGMTLSRVNVGAIPEPTEVKEISENGDHDVRRYGTARVNVSPTLQSKIATPTEQAQTVLPDTGFDGLESVEIGRIPSEYIIPTGTKNISQNGTENVREYDSVNVSVEPTLQDKTVIPTKQTQTVNADSGYDGLESVQVDPIPSEYIVPAGKVVITQNGTFNVSQYAEAEVDVSNRPTKGVVFGDFNSNGCPTSATTYGFTQLPEWYFYDIGHNRYNRGLVMGWISRINLNEGITDLTRDSCLREMAKVTELQMPSTLERIGGTFLFNNTPLTLLDMSLLNSVPTLTTAGMGLPSGCTIRVKQSLLADWQNATNWCDLTGVVWEGV